MIARAKREARRHAMAAARARDFGDRVMARFHTQQREYWLARMREAS